MTRNSNRETREFAGASADAAPTRFAAMIKEAREAKGWNYSEVAKKIWGETVDSRGYTLARNRGVIPRLESGKTIPRARAIADIAEALGIDVDELGQARDEAENAREDRIIPETDFTAGAVAGQPHLVQMTIKAVVPLERFALIVKQTAAAVEEAKATVGEGGEGDADDA